MPLQSFKRDCLQPGVLAPEIYWCPASQLKQWPIDPLVETTTLNRVQKSSKETRKKAELTPKRVKGCEDGAQAKESCPGRLNVIEAI